MPRYLKFELRPIEIERLFNLSMNILATAHIREQPDIEESAREICGVLTAATFREPVNIRVNSQTVLAEILPVKFDTRRRLA
jgi:hypothetical protein